SEMARFFDMTPRVAMLSFSNFGSSRHPETEKVAEAARIARACQPQLAIDGEMQADTALVEEILNGAFAFNRLQQPANVLIFPGLAAGNIAYKLVDRLGAAKSVGPLLMGISKPFNVLQRDTDMENVVNVIAITVAQAQNHSNKTD
ncbi:MAG: NADP-dependent malic enzyme, partial [Desulfatitalea sp.]|nr:NADP-dependent malic enzyme [Desulfatitalea sp.]